jgi:hypothetical protein
MGFEGTIRHYLTDSIEIDPGEDAKSFKRRGERERLSAVYIRDPAPNPNREVKLDYGPALPLLQGVEELQNGCLSAPFFGILLFFPVFRRIHSTSELKNCQTFIFVMESVSVGAEVQECRDIRLKLLSRKRSNLLLIHCISGEAQSGEEICSIPGLRHKKRRVRDVCRVSGM